MRKLIAFFALTVMSCNHRSDTTTSTSPTNVDSLTAQFNAAWNNKDSAAIIKTIADNAILMNDSLIYRGDSAISKNWISGGVKVVSNIKTSSVIKDSDNKLAYDAGTYTHDLTTPGGSVLKLKGNYSFAWAKQPDGEWKLTFIHIEDLTRMP